MVGEARVVANSEERENKVEMPRKTIIGGELFESIAVVIVELWGYSAVKWIVSSPFYILQC